MSDYRAARKPDNGWREQGGYMQAKRSKLEIQFASEAPLESQLFHGISIYVNGYTNPPASVLRRLVSTHGGRYCTYYQRSSVTHVIASQLTMSKANQLCEDRVVSATWIVECIKAKKLLPWQNYRLSYGYMNSGKQRHLRFVQEPMNNTNSESTAVLSPDQYSCTAITGHDEVESSEHTEDSDSRIIHRMKQLPLDSYISPTKKSGVFTSSCSRNPADAPSLRCLLGGNAYGVPNVPTVTPLISSAKCNSFSRSSTDPKRTAAQQTTASTDSLLTTFYSRSRLHHLSAWTNDLRALVQRLRQVNSFEAACREGATWRQSILETNDPSYFVNLEARPACSSPKQGKPPSLPARTFFHIDLDCFFVSVAVREKPELKDKAIAIAHTTGTGTYENASERGFHSMSEIASCSYAARKAGVRNGMLLGQARQICPDLLTLPYDFEAYKEVSEQLYRTIAEFTLDIKATSCDELYADCTDLLTVSVDPMACTGQHGVRQRIINPLLLGEHLRKLVELRTNGCTATVGFGSSLLLARLATKKAKPNGQAWFLGSSVTSKTTGIWRWYIADAPAFSDPKQDCELSGSDADWLRSLPLQELPGVGRVLANRLVSAFGAFTCGDLMKAASLSQLKDLLGPKTGERLYWLCRGRDPTEVLHFERERKSVSACINYGLRLQTYAELDQLVRSLSHELTSRMSNAQTIQNNPGGLKGVEAQSLTVRVLLRSPNAPRESTKYMGHGVCDSSSRTHTFSEPTADVETIHRTTLSILRHLCPDPRELRGLGLQVNRLSPPSSTERSSALTHLERYTIAPNLATIPQTTVAASPILATDCSPEPSLSHDSLSPFVPCLTPIHLLVQKRHKPLRIKPHRTIRSALSINSDNVPRAFEIEPTYDEDVDSETTNKLASANTSTRDLCDSSGAPSSFDARRKHATTHEHLVGQIESSACMIPPRSEDSNARSRSRQHHPISARLSVSDLKIMFRNKPTDRIRQMLANWIVTEPRPLSEDVCALASCLVSLVPYNLEGVRSCLIWLNQVMDQFCPRGSSKEEWRTYIARIRATVEHSIQLCYNASLLP